MILEEELEGSERGQKKNRAGITRQWRGVCNASAETADGRERMVPLYGQEKSGHKDDATCVRIDRPETELI